MREVVLPSGATLKVTAAPFAASKALYQALLRELRGVDASSYSALLQQVFCSGFSSPEIEACLWECFKRCSYDGGAGDLKIDKDTFEPLERRQDYMDVCIEVAKENVLPFVNRLYAEFQKYLLMVTSTQA